MKRFLTMAVLLTGVAVGKPAAAQNAANGKATVGGADAAAIDKGAERIRGFYYYRGDCFRKVGGGFTRVSSRSCGVRPRSHLSFDTDRPAQHLPLTAALNSPGTA